MGLQTRSLTACCGAEVLGTFLLVFFGCGAVHVAVLTGDLHLFHVALVWAVAIMLAIYVVAGISGAHINPAITVALAVWGRFRWADVVPYVLAQLAGAIAAAVVLFALFGPFLSAREKDKGVTRGEPGSEITAMCYGEYFPNPGPLSAGGSRYDRDDHVKRNALVSAPAACAAEVLGTLILALVVFAVTAPRTRAAPVANLPPLFISLPVPLPTPLLPPLP